MPARRKARAARPGAYMKSKSGRVLNAKEEKRAKAVKKLEAATKRVETLKNRASMTNLRGKKGELMKPPRKKKRIAKRGK